MSCSNKLVRFVCFCVVDKVFMYCCITSPKGLDGIGGGGGWSTIERFCSSHSRWSKLSAGCPSPASTCQHKSFISLMRAVNLSWLLYIGSSGWPSASGPPKATIASEWSVLPLLLSMSMGYCISVLRLMLLSWGCPAPPWWVAIECVSYIVQ